MTQESAEEDEFQMPRVFDGEIQEIVFDSGKYADLLSPLQRHSAGINRAPDPAVSVIVNWITDVSAKQMSCVTKQIQQIEIHYGVNVQICPKKVEG